MPEKYKPGDLLTLEEAAEHFGYNSTYLRTLSSPTSHRPDPDLIRLRIRTDSTWRKAFNSKALVVYEYSGLKTWFRNHQEEPSVRAWNEGRGIIVEV